MDKNKDGKEKKKSPHDLRDEGPAPISVTNTQSRMAGGADNPNVSSLDDNPVHHPGVRDQMPPGETVKDS